MKSILISIQPRWCELIASGKKTIEIRKSKPKLDVPFKVYIYCTKEKTRFEHTYIPTTYENLILNKNIDRGCQVHFYNGIPKNELCTILNGKVIGEFVCDRITEYECSSDGFGELATTCGTCLTYDEILNYCNGNDLYGWHISDLVIYDKPKELSEFFSVKESGGYDEFKVINRPPQSWFYCEKIDAKPLVEGKTITIPKWEYKE